MTVGNDMNRNNQASNFFTEGKTKELTRDEITSYFSVLRNILPKYMSTFDFILLNIYESAAKNEGFNSIDNPLVKAEIEKKLEALKINMEKKEEVESRGIFSSELIDITFEKMLGLIYSNSVLTNNVTLREFLVDLTPSIEEQIKVSVENNGRVLGYI